MEQRWSEIDRGKPKYSWKDLSQCHFVNHKSHMDTTAITTTVDITITTAAIIIIVIIIIIFNMTAGDVDNTLPCYELSVCFSVSLISSNLTRLNILRLSQMFCISYSLFVHSRLTQFTAGYIRIISMF